MSLFRSKNMSLFREGYDWKPVDTYVDAIWARSRLRRWGLTKKYIESALSGIGGHRDVLHPTAVKLTLGKGAGYDWAEANAWLADAVGELGSKYFDDCTEIARSRKWFHYARNSGPTVELEPELQPSHLDLESFHLKDEVAWNDRPIMLHLIDERETWPGTDMAWLFALNPEMFLSGWARHRYTNLYLPGIVLTDDKGGDEEARDSCGSTGWGFVPEFRYGGPVTGFGHRSGSVGPGMCFVSYAA
jgi:hypothetical protein